MITLEQVLREIDALPTLGTAVTRLCELIKDETADAEDFEHVIKPDPALTANLLRLANSGYFRGRGEVTTVKQAVVTLGLKRVFELAAGGSFARTLPPDLAGYGIDAGAFWRHSIAVAVIGEELSKNTSGAAPDMAFTAGLLHDVGKLALCTSMSADELLTSLGEATLLAGEEARLGFSHAEVGAMVAESWNLPPVIVAACRWHHEPGSCEDHQGTVDLIHLADALAHQFGLGADVGELHRALDAKASARLGITIQDAELSVACAIGEINELCDLFEAGGTR